ncbi:polyamine deacetylase HDAC10 isoform 8 [Mus musculus]|uniref:polyamine deacetylase HDAC10 isoform 8 n=1 Tax=Mus musculus TaxID=10090 RepID=UPI0003D75795|nr:polyamine deacetylase HDAC10 isoform 8 [Mus musculus]|eukprot:XP_006520606.1 PREDICTED: histone deacetylase 10 isoform X2 [Mus musculus]
MGTALVYHEDMTATRLLWDDPECEIECPERLTAALDGLRQRGLEERCLCLSACEASEEELGLVHSPEYIALVQKTQTLDKEELHALSKQYNAVYFHPDTFHCARLAAGAALQLVDAVLTGAVHNGLALVRPPGHHSQRAAANGFCVFNNVALAAKHAKQKYGLQRILIVDWDVHHGQGIQYIFNDDPSVLYFSWHRYEHGSFWPFLPESDADAVGQGQGQGFTVNLPWNQVGMGNADYLAAFLHVLLPLAFEFDPELVLVSAGFDSAIGDPEGQMQATPECFAHLTQLLQVLAGGRICAVLEGGYHLESLAQSVCMMVQTLLGDPTPPLLGLMVPCQSALESIQSVQTAQTPYWTSLQQNVAPVLSSSTHSPEERSLRLLGESPTCAVAEDSLSPLLDQLCLRPAPPICTAVASTVPGAALCLPPGVLHQEGSVLREETEAWARLHKSRFQDEDLATLGKILCLLDGIMDGQIRNAIATTTALATAATLDVLIQRCLARRAQRRILWLNIRGKDAAIQSMFHFSTPLPQTTGGFLSLILGLVLPLAYGFQPDMVLMALGPAHGLQNAQAALLAAMLRSPVGGRILAVVEEESIRLLARSLAQALHGETPPSLGPFSKATPEEIQALMFLKARLEARWKLLQVAAPPP